MRKEFLRMKAIKLSFRFALFIRISKIRYEFCISSYYHSLFVSFQIFSVDFHLINKQRVWEHFPEKPLRNLNNFHSDKTENSLDGKFIHRILMRNRENMFIDTVYCENLLTKWFANKGEMLISLNKMSTKSFLVWCSCYVNWL